MSATVGNTGSLNRAKAVTWVLVSLAVIPLLFAFGAAATAAPSSDSEDSPGFVAFVTELVTTMGYSLLIAAHLGVAAFVVTLRERNLMPLGASVPIVAGAGSGLLLLDLAITGIWPDALGVAAFVLGITIGATTIATMVWLGYQLARVVFQPHVAVRFRRHRMAMVSGLVLLLLGAVALAYPLIDSDADAIRPSSDHKYASAQMSPPFGADHLGRNVLLRLIRGAQVSLAVGLISSISCAVVGTIIGALAGFYGGWIDNVLMRLVDMRLSLPVIAVLIVLAAVNIPAHIASAMQWGDTSVLGLDLAIWNIVLIVVLFGWMTVARLVRGEVLKQKAEAYVEAGTALGYSDIRILWGHILPNCMAPIIVATTLSVGEIILYESALSFLGLGIKPPEVSWGGMIHESKSAVQDYPLLSVLPGLAILLTVVSFNFLGDGLRDALDPRHVTAAASAKGDPE
jgi:peptide/nickel transport system permease protein